MMNEIQEHILNFLEEEANSDINFLILEDKLNNLIVSDNHYYLLSLLHLISKIANNHLRFPLFPCNLAIGFLRLFSK